METIVIALLSAVVGGFISAGVQRLQTGWLKRRETAAESYQTALQVHRVMLSSIAGARRVHARMEATPSGRWHEITHDAAHHLGAHARSLREAIGLLSDATIKCRAVWGDEVARVFDRLVQLSSAWSNALVQMEDDVQGNVQGEDVFGEDETGHNWWNVTRQVEPDTTTLGAELDRLIGWIGTFARSVGVVVASPFVLPPAVREVVAEFEDDQIKRRERQLAPPQD